MVIKTKHIIEGALIIRVATQMSAPLFDDMSLEGSETTVGDFLYFLGRDILEIILIFTAYWYEKDNDIRRWLLFWGGFATYNCIEPFLADPTDIDPFEYWGFVIGIFFMVAPKIWQYIKMFLQYVFKRINNRHNN